MVKISSAENCHAAFEQCSLCETLWPGRAHLLYLPCLLRSSTPSRLLQQSLLQCHAHHCRACRAARHTHARTHTGMHAYTLTYTFKYTRKDTNTHTHACKYTHSCIHTYTRNTHAHTQACTHCTDSADGLCQLFCVAGDAPPLA